MNKQKEQCETDFTSSSFTESDFRKLDAMVDKKFKNVHELKTIKTQSCEQTSGGDDSRSKINKDHLLDCEAFYEDCYIKWPITK